MSFNEFLRPYRGSATNRSRKERGVVPGHQSDHSHSRALDPDNGKDPQSRSSTGRSSYRKTLQQLLAYVDPNVTKSLAHLAANTRSILERHHRPWRHFDQ